MRLVKWPEPDKPKLPQLWAEFKRMRREGFLKAAREEVAGWTWDIWLLAIGVGAVVSATVYALLAWAFGV